MRDEEQSTLKLRNNNATIGELSSDIDEVPSSVRGQCNSNARSLRLIVRAVHRGNPDQKTTSVLTANLIREFEKRRIQRVEENGGGCESHRSDSPCSKLDCELCRQARSVVALRKMKFYEDMKLPDLASFRAESVETPQRSLPRPLDMKALSAMEAAVPALSWTKIGALCGAPTIFALRSAKHRNRQRPITLD